MSKRATLTVAKLIELKEWLDKQLNAPLKTYPVAISKKTIKQFRDAGSIDFTDEQIDAAESTCTPLFYCEGCAVYVDLIIKNITLTENEK